MASTHGYPPPALAIYDLASFGHHRMYLEHMVAWWNGFSDGRTLDIWVPPSFTDRHPDFHAAAESEVIRVRLLPDDVTTDGENAPMELTRRHRKALGYMVESGANRILAMVLDHAQLAVRSVDPAKARISGILFRSQLGYPEKGMAGRARALRKRWTLRLALPHLDKVLLLDPFEVNGINHMAGRNAAVHLPDGLPDLPHVPDRSSLRSALGLADGDHVAFVGGSLSVRKGLRLLAESVDRMSASTRERLVLAFVGQIPEGEESEVHSCFERMARKVRVVQELGFATDERLATWWAACDSVPVTYDGHVGSSHNLLRAAQLGKPVLGTDEQLMGRWIRENALGALVAPGDAEGLARAFDRLLAEGGNFFDRDRAMAFGARFSARHMHAVLTETMGGEA